ncbi:MAG TPA: hypothetical protein V6D29_17870 [Leptolyngbyaceae cyanobacterium]
MFDTLSFDLTSAIGEDKATSTVNDQQKIFDEAVSTNLTFLFAVDICLP